MHYLKNLVPQKIKNIYHLGQAILANLWYGFPSRKITVIGATGTNGKTTTCQMIAKILEEAGFRTAMISTINFKLGEKEWINDTKYTTLSSFKVQEFIRQAVEAKCSHLVLETSSHALDQNRVWGVNYNIAVMTNLTREHLDYHKTMEKYRQAKLKLFKKVETVVVNLDMEKPQDFLQLGGRRKYGYTTRAQNADFKAQNDNIKCEVVLAENIEIEADNSKFSIKGFQFKVNMPGLFNIENALAAICVGLREGISLEKISQALGEIQGVPGRLEFVPNNKEMNIIIDYAVTPDSLEKLYKLITQIKEVRPLSAEATQRGQTSINSKIIAVFGACGERDRGKRPIMGEIVSRYADCIILTNEDPYNEDPMQIINEVASGIEITNYKSQIPNDIQNLKFKNQKEFIQDKNFWIILDRREAIKKALQLARPDDFVVVTGKGAEETMAVGNQRIPWNDKMVILEELKKVALKKQLYFS